MSGSIPRDALPICYITDRQPEPFDIETTATHGQIDFRRLPDGAPIARAADADALHVWGLPIDAARIAALPNLRAIVRMGVGFDNVDIAAAAARGIVAAVVPDYGTNEVADLAFAHLLDLNRDLRAQTADFLETGRFEPFAWGGSFRLQGKRLGIVGLGRIGTAVARRAQAFGIEVLFYDPYLPDGCDKALQVTRVDDLGELVASSHLISIHCPLSPETDRMFNAAVFSCLRPGALLVNTARGPIVDPSALLEAAGSGRLGGFGFDVYATEPPDPADPFIRFLRDRAARGGFRLSVSHHSGFHSGEALLELRRKAAEETLRILIGKQPRNPVNLHLMANR